MMIMAKKKEPKQESQEEGEVYVAATGSYYSKPQIDARKIKDIIRNNYLADQVFKLQSQTFTEKYRVEVRDRNGEVVPEMEDKMLAMLEAPGVQLWTRMQQAWVDIWEWGCFLANPVWEMNGPERILAKLRRLPPESFNHSPNSVETVYSEILPGIYLNDQGEMEFWQSTSDTSLEMVRLTNVFMATDPMSTELAGTSKIIPLVPLVTMLDFCWQAQMQKVNRVGSPTLFIKVTNPVKNASRDDVAYANTILKNWGKGTAYQLRDNMEVVELNLADNEAALNTIEALKARIKDFFSPSALMKKEGATIGGNAASEKAEVDTWKEGQQQMIESQFNPLAQEYLDSNGYEGFTVALHIGSQNVSVGDLEAKQAQIGYVTKSLTINEIRQKLAVPELSDDDLARLMDDYAKLNPPAPATPAAPSGLPYAFGPKEHVPTPEERALEAELQKIYDDASKQVMAALGSVSKE
jgi:hypothetical protein